MGHPGHAGSQRNRCATRRTRRRHPGVPRIESWPENLVEGVGAGAKLRRVGHGIDDAALSFEMSHQNVGGFGNAVGVDQRTLGGAYASHVGQVFDRHRQAGQQTTLVQRLLHQLPGPSARPVKTSCRQRIDLAVDLGDALFNGIEAIQWGDFAALEPVHDLVGGQANQFCHVSSFQSGPIESVCRTPVNRRKSPPKRRGEHHERTSHRSWS